jgi:hypothetical protein
MKLIVGAALAASLRPPAKSPSALSGVVAFTPSIAVLKHFWAGRSVHGNVATAEPLVPPRECNCPEGVKYGPQLYIGLISSRSGKMTLTLSLAEVAGKLFSAR